MNQPLTTGHIALDKQLARWYPLIDHPVQLSLVGAVDRGVRFPLVPAGRRCLEAGTLVATPSGPRAIESLQIGDLVIGFDGDKAAITAVTATWDNGEQGVIPLLSGKRELLAATDSHHLWATYENDLLHFGRVPVEGLTKRWRVRRQYAGELITGGQKSVLATYVLGAILGNGCCRDGGGGDGRQQKRLNISAPDETVPAYIAQLLRCSYRKLHENNFTYSIDVGIGAIDAVPFYKEWAHNRYSHEKMADWAEIDQWDRDSALSFLAGVIDSDGSVFWKSPANIALSISMQAKTVIDCCMNIVHKFFQEKLFLHQDVRTYKGGPVWAASATNSLLVKRIIKGLGDRLIMRGKMDTSEAVGAIREERIGLRKGVTRIARTYDITVGNDTNLYCLHNGGIVSSNSGKTERFKRFIVKKANSVPGLYFAAAPTHDQAKKIFWDDLKALSLSSMHRKAPSETNRVIYFPNDSEIHVFGLDKPERIDGIPWKGGGVDEIADTKEGGWEENILPALNTVDPRTPDYLAWCWLLGVPDGLNFYYDLCERARTSDDSNFEVFHWKSAEILPAHVIEDMKRAMGARQFRQEFEASFETASGRIYDEYGLENTTTETILPHEQLLWHHDFNFTPMSSGVGVRRNNALFVLDEIVLTSAIARQSALEFIERFKNHKNRTVIIYGDPAGRAGEKHGHASDYTDMENVLKSNGWTVVRKVKNAAPAIRDRQNAVRAKVCNASGERTLFINPAKAPYAHKGLSIVQFMKGSTYQEEKSDYQHITTAIGYCIDYEWPAVDKKVQPTVAIAPTMNRFGKPGQ